MLFSTVHMEYLSVIFCVVYVLNFVYALPYEENLQTKTYYMTRDCKPPANHESYMGNRHMGNRQELKVSLGGAVIYSHREGEEQFPQKFDCMVVANAGEGRKIHVNIQKLDIPTASGDLCTNALYLYDSNTFLTKGMANAGGDAGMCNKVEPKTLTTTASYLTLVLRTDYRPCENCPSTAQAGLKLVLTSVQDARKDASSQGRACPTPGDFLCGGAEDNLCIPASLKCDSVANCRHASDENRSLAKCGRHEEAVEANKPLDRSLFGKIFSLGVSASIAIVAGSILCLIVCIAGTVCCCFRCSRTRQKNAAAAATLSARPPPPPPPGLSASGSTGADSAFHGGGFLPMMAVAGGAGCGSDRSEMAASHKYYSVNGGHYSASSGGTASPYNYKKNAPGSLASSGYQALVYSGSKSFSAASGGGGPVAMPEPHPHSHPHPHPSGLHGGYPSSIYSYQSSHSSAAHAPPTYRDSLLSSTGGRLHSPTSSRSGRSLHSSVTYHAYNPTPSLVNPDERIEYPVQL